MLGNTKNIKLGHTSGGQANVSTREHVTSLSGFFNCYDGLQRTCELVSHKQAINPFVLQRKRATDRSTFYKLPPPPGAGPIPSNVHTRLGAMAALN